MIIIVLATKKNLIRNMHETKSFYYFNYYIFNNLYTKQINICEQHKYIHLAKIEPAIDIIRINITEIEKYEVQEI